MKSKFNALADAGIAVTASMTTPSRSGKKPRPVFIVTGRVAECEEILRDLGGKKFCGEWSFWSDPSDAILEALNKRGRLSFAEQVALRAERKLAKIDRYTEYAAKAQVRADHRSARASTIRRMIPMGQPILVGHYSEGRHLRDLARIDTNMRKSWEESEKAKHYTNKVVGLEHAVDRLKSRSYIGNRLRDARAHLRRLHRNAHCYADFASREEALEAQVSHWASELAKIENSHRELGVRIPNPRSLKQGYSVRYRGSWYPVVRVSPKTVTIGNWLGVASMTYRLEYSELSEYREQ